MKIWMKLVIGTVLGSVLGMLLPFRDPQVAGVVSWMFVFVVNTGKYILVPLVLFTLPVAIHQLKDDRLLAKTVMKSVGTGFGIIIAFVLIGVLSVLLLQPERIPQTPSDLKLSITGIDVPASIMSLFPPNLILGFSGPGSYVLPLLVLGFLVGLAFSADKISLKPIIQLSDALSRLFYSINDVFVEFAGIGAIVLAAFGVFSLRNVADFGAYSGILFVLVIDAFLLAFGILPAIIWFTTKRRNPWKYLFAIFGPALAAFLAGDVNYSMGMLFKHAKESLGARRRANSITITIASLFGRAGSAFISAVAFLVVLKSHSNIGISPGEILWLVVVSLALSPFSGASPGSGAFSAVITLCALYGKGFENGWIILQPVAFIIIALGSFIDILVAGTITMIVSETGKMREEREVRHFI